MREEQITEIKRRLWNHLQSLQRRLQELRDIGIIPHEGEWENIRYIGRRNRWFILDQLFFCRDEIEFWKTVIPDE